MTKKLTRLGRGLGIGLMAGIVALVLWSLGSFDAWERPTWTWRMRFFSNRETLSPRIKFVLLDQASLDWAADPNGSAWSWPWPRLAYGVISDFCQRGGARAVAYDLLFTEPSIYNQFDDDQTLGEAIAAGPPTVLAVMSGGSADAWPESVPRPGLDLQHASLPVEDHLLFPVPEITEGATAVGHVTGRADADGVYRRVTPVCRFSDQDVPLLGLAAWLAAEGNEVPISTTQGQLNVGSHVVPVDDQGRTILRFKGADGLPQAKKASSVIQSELLLQEGETPVLSPDEFKDCIVFVGGSAPALKDLRSIPINANCPGVVLHATFVDNLMSDSFMAETPRPVVVVGVLALAVCAGLSLTFGGRWYQAGPLAVAGLGLPMAIGFGAYAAGWWWPVVVQTLASALAMVGALTANYWAEGRQKAFIKRAFKHYLSSHVIDQILHNPQALQLGGQKRELTIMFTDLAGFSSFSERLDPEELTALLNGYLTEMTDIILEEGGTLDKYEGDAIIAFWNAPLAQPDHAVRACRAALRCQQRLETLRQGYKERTGAELRMRVGLHTGEVVVGNMGSTQRFNYTILGDAANLAARLEGANKAFGTETMVSETTWHRVAQEFRGRKLADLRVLGRKTPTPVYEMTGFASEPVPEAWGVFSKGLDEFRTGGFASALETFNTLPEDRAACRYVQRCQALMADPPKDWEGVWDMTHK